LLNLLSTAPHPAPYFPDKLFSEEEEEQVPTDGGTSAEAMQVPLEEDDELEEEEIINDENFLGKRPLDSPEAEEMPVMKRPRLMSAKGDSADVVLLEAREPLSSINTQKVPPMLSPVHVQDGAELAPASPEPPTLAPVAKAQMPGAKPLEAKAFAPKTKTKAGSPGQKTKSPKTTQPPAMVGSPIRSPKTASKEKKSPGRSKSPKSPKSPKAMTPVPPVPARPETPNRTPSAAGSEKGGREPVPAKAAPPPADAAKPSGESQPKRAAVADKTIDDSIDAVIARACAEREPDPFEFSSGSESEGDMFTSPKRISGSECAPPKAPASANSVAKSGPAPLPPPGGASGSDHSWTMDASIDEVVRKAKLGAPPHLAYGSSPSASPPTPEPPPRAHEEKSKPPSSGEVKRKLKKELKTKMRKKEKQRDRERDKDRNKEKSREKDKAKEKEKEAGKEAKYPWKEFLKDEDSDPYKFKIKEFEDVDPKVRLKDGIVRKEKEKHKDKKRDRERGKKDKEKREKEKVKEKGREEKMKAPPAPLVLPPKEMALPLFSPAAAARVPAMLPSLAPMLPEKLFEEKEKPKEKERKKDKKEKKKKKEKEKEKEKKEKEREKEKREREKREKEKEKHKHEKIKVEPVIPAPSPVIPRLTLRVGAGQDKIVISKVVPAPEAKPAPSLNRPKTPPPAAAPPAPGPAHPAPPPAPLAAACPALLSLPGPAAAGSAKAPVRSVVTETVSTYVIRDEWGNQIWICPGCNKPDDGSPMIGCDDCDDWYHWPCVGIMAAPPEEMQWFCPKCANKKKDKKHKKRKHRAH
uniref:Transcription initiation factor TFIID subunit 3 n=1 Tax=Propithecus coquereli TaxID=379532 RepID=A0A2K6G6E6_PROCO